MLPYINLPFEYASSLTGASIDELKLIFSFLLSYPLAAVLKRIPDEKPWQKNLFIIAVSLFNLVGLFDLWAGIRTVLISSAGAYAIAKYVDGPLMPWIGFVFLMGHMSINHIYRQFVNDAGLVDITGVQMVLVMKLTAFCWNVEDGRLPPEEMADFQRDHALPQLPNLLDFAGYVLFFPSLFAGPAFDYIDYRRWIETTMFEVPAGTDPSIKPKTRKRRKIPQSHLPATIKLITGLVWIFLFLQFNKWYNTALVLDDSYLSYGLLRRIWHLQMLGFVTRMKYYGVWTLTEGACVLAGIGYRGVDPKTGKVDWNRLQNVNPLGVELAQNSRAYLENWNMNTNHWLRNYMYLRVTPKGKKPGFRASLATFTTSAFWHGFYPGYYLSFVLAAFLQTVAKNFRRHLRPFFLSPTTGAPTPYKPAYDLVCYLLTQTAFCFTTAPFVLLTLPDSLLVWSRVYFYAVVGTAISLAFFASPGKGWLIRQLKGRNERIAKAAGAGKTEDEGKGKQGESKGVATGAGTGTGIGSGMGTATTPGAEAAPGFGGLGLPDDPEREVQEAVEELREEVEVRRRGGAKIAMPTAEELRRAVVGEKSG